MPVRNELIKTSLRGAVTETAANTYTEVQVDTNLAIRGDHVFIISGIWFLAAGSLAGAADMIQCQIAYASQTGIISVNDPDWLCGWRWRMELTTSGSTVWEPMRYIPINHFPIAVSGLYLGIQGASLGAAATIAAKIEGYHQKVNTQEYFRLAQSR